MRIYDQLPFPLHAEKDLKRLWDWADMEPVKNVDPLRDEKWRCDKRDELMMHVAAQMARCDLGLSFI